ALTRRRKSTSSGFLPLQFLVPSFTRIRSRLAQVAWLTLCLLLLSVPAAALDVPPLKRHVNDLAGLLSASEAQALEQKLSQYEAATTNQFVLLTVPSLEGDVLEDFSLRVVERWQLGQKQQDNGLLLLVAKADRKMRFEVGYGLEGNLPDALAGRIIRDGMAPAFKRGDFAGGINLAFDAAMEAASGKEIQLPQRAVKQLDPIGDLLPMGLFLLFVLFALSRRGRHGG